MNFVANFDVTCDFGVRVAIKFPTVFPLLHRDYRFIHFQDRPCDLRVFDRAAKAALLSARLAAAEKLSADSSSCAD